MADSTSEQAEHLPQPIEIEIDEFRLIEGTCKPLLFAGFVTIFINYTAASIATATYSSIVDSFLAGVAGAFCMSVGLAIPLFVGWGVAVYLGNRLNSILGKPLNPSAVAALASGVGFGTAHTLTFAGIKTSSRLDPSIAIFATIALVGSLLFQVVARVRVRREIARHNLRAARKPYAEPPCHVRFQISQMMILMFAVSVLLALAIRVADGGFVLLVALWGLLTATTFYPAILISKWVDQKLGSVTLQPWEPVRRLDWQDAVKNKSAPVVQLADEAASETSSVVADRKPAIEDNVLDSIPSLPRVPKFNASGAMTSAVRWIGFAGGAFGVLLVIFLEASKAMHHESVNMTGMFLAIPCVLGGLIFATMLSAFILLFLGVINFVTGNRIRMGTLAALAGGLVGSLGAWILLCGLEVVHFVPWNGAFDLSEESNRFPLAIVLLASLMGQIFGRLGVKNYGYQKGLSHEQYQSESTGFALSPYSLLVLILSVCAWSLVFIGNKAGPGMMNVEDHLATAIVGAFACTFSIWPFANLLARSVVVAPKRSHKPAFALPTLRQPRGLG